MLEGSVVSVNIAPAGGEAMFSLDEVRAVAGKGLEGDRYFSQDKADLTLMEIETIEELRRDYELDLEPRDARRNIVTRGVALSHLVGEEFMVGDVRVRGVKLKEPCAHLASLTDEKVLKGLVHRAGLAAEILSDGVIRAGDAVRKA